MSSTHDEKVLPRTVQKKQASVITGSMRDRKKNIYPSVIQIVRYREKKYVLTKA